MTEKNYLQNVLHADEAADLESKINGVFISGVTNATPNTEDGFAHTLGRVPRGFIVITKDKAGDMYAGSTANTNALIYLKNAVASVAFSAYII